MTAIEEARKVEQAKTDAAWSRFLNSGATRKFMRECNEDPDSGITVISMDRKDPRLFHKIEAAVEKAKR